MAHDPEVENIPWDEFHASYHGNFYGRIAFVRSRQSAELQEWAFPECCFRLVFGSDFFGRANGGALWPERMAGAARSICRWLAPTGLTTPYRPARRPRPS